MKLFVTTSYKPNPQMLKRALEISSKLEIPYFERGNKSLAALVQEIQTDIFILVEKHKESVVPQGNAYFFHPNLAKLRVKALQEGKKDTMIEAMGLKKGDNVLDCTLGLGSDAIVSSYWVGKDGKVVGIESSSLISLLVKQGLNSYLDDYKEMISAMRRIMVVNQNYEIFLKEQPSKQFDIVYFDPMFRWPIKKSDAISAIRSLANNASVNLNAVKEATRVAKKCVVIKERRNSSEFERLKCTRVYGGKYSPIAYGVIEVEVE